MSDAQDRVDWHAGLAQLQARGVPFNAEALRRRVADELRLVDRARSEGALRSVTRTKAERDEARRARRAARPELQAHAQARKVGGEFFTREAPRAATTSPRDATKSPILQMPKGLEGERLAALAARVNLLCSRAQGTQRRNGSMSDGPWLYPKFAPRLAVLSVFFARGLGGFKGLSYADRQRRFVREVERICDESNAAVGVGWWVDRKASR